MSTQTRRHANSHSPMFGPQGPATLSPQGGVGNAASLEVLAASAPESDSGFLDGLGLTELGAFVDEQDPRAQFTTEDGLTGRNGHQVFPKRWEDGTLRVPAPAQRELRANALDEGAPRPLDIDETDWDHPEGPLQYFEPWSKSEDCATATYSTLEKMGYEAPKGDRNSVLKRGQIGKREDGRVTDVDEDAARVLLDSIDGALLEGTPAMVGVDYHAGETANTDQVTDHWFVIVGRTYDEVTGEVQYVAMDNADQGAPIRHFTVGEDYALTSAPPEGATGAAGSTYTATNARIPEPKP